MRLKPMGRIMVLLVIAGFSAPLLTTHPSSLVRRAGIAIVCACLVRIAFALPALWRDRRDRYDLCKLYDPEPESLDRESDDEELVYCWHCGDAFPKAFD